MTVHFMNQILGKKKLNLQQLATFITYVKIKMEKIVLYAYRKKLRSYSPVS